ncbi:putative manganese-transporting ATPase PDR2 [Diplonema papillatum]|nr:putative manganese-transporting ATPase PDR2 [Diplonema papillatum]
MELRHPPSLGRCTVHVFDKSKQIGLLSLVVLLYAGSIQWCVSTMGEPYAAAVEEARRVHDFIITEEAKQPKQVDWAEDEEELEHIDDLEAMDTEDDEYRFTFKPSKATKEGWKQADEVAGEAAVDEFDEEASSGTPLRDESEAESDPPPADAAAVNSTMEAKQKIPLPSEMLPSAWAAAFLFLLVTMHALFHLLCHWNVGFKAAALYSRAASVHDDCYIFVRTLPHHGKPDLIKFTRDMAGKLAFEFQRRKYFYVEAPNVTEDMEVIPADDSMGAVIPVSPVIDEVLRTYGSRGLSSEEVAQQLKKYGENRLTIVPPSLFTMWRQQLISPVPIFQFFTSILWMLDEYVQYTMFTLLIIVMLEGGTAFQRQRALQQLTKMSMKAYPVWTLRDNKWKEVITQDLVPGDVISLSVMKTKAEPAKPEPKPGGKVVAAGKDEKPAPAEQAHQETMVPCDCLLLKGSAVVNEASLTGESIPAMKDQAPTGPEADVPLSIEGKHRVHTLFSGTTLVDAKPEEAPSAGFTAPPNNGIVCHVLRTGFGSSQGSLMQLIEFSTEGVAGDTRETFFALLILLCFAIVAAVYVFQKGMEKGTKTTHELLIKSVLIITSVVPRQLPMQMALAVNTAVMALMKSGVMCTEPFRVPIAGKITHTLFDKTGTLTTDTLIPAGIVNSGKDNPKGGTDSMLPVRNASEICSIILAGCQSLVSVGSGDDATLVGDPIEVAALRGVEWRYDAKKQIAARGNWEAKERVARDLAKELRAYKETTKRHKELTSQIASLKQEAAAMKEQTKTDKLAVKIKHRFHFSSQLQRMSVIAEVTGMQPNTAPQHYVLVKGSPEAIQKLLAKSASPEWFESTYVALMEQGMRVLALGYKAIDTPSKEPSREALESDLQFAGFVAFSCRVRNDSAAVISALRASKHDVAMVTGDGPLTALHVAKHVGICRQPMSYTLEVHGDTVEWVGAVGETKPRTAFQLADVEEFGTENDLMTTEENLEKAATALGEGVWRACAYVKVFARMSPSGKAKVIRALQESHGAHVLMCGDGSNDVGALKQANCALALLSGYGNANTGADDEVADDMSAEDVINKHAKELEEKTSKANAVKRELFGQKQKELMTKKGDWLKEELDKREARGEEMGLMTNWAAMQATLKRIQDEMKKEQVDVNKTVNVYAPSLDDVLASSEDTTTMIRPGDASVAAPFTSRLPTIKSCVDLIRQGRCTLLSALQQQQIMMLESLIQAFTLSALSLEGARQSERQMMASSWLLSIAILAFTYATPVDKMHPVRPLRSLFHPAIFFSMFGQALIHIYCMNEAVTMATRSMGPDELAAVVEFHRRAAAKEIVEEEYENAMDYYMAFWSSPFKPNLLNTVVFLVESSQTVAVLFVNYKGRPWMKGLLENHALFLSLFTTFAGVAYIAWGVSPEINSMFHFAAFPDDDFRWNTIRLVAISVVGTFIWDRIATALFAPHIFKIMLEEAGQTRFSDFLPMLTTLGKALGGLILISTVNPLILFGFYYFVYRNIGKKQLGD